MKGSNNFIGFANVEADQVLEALDYEHRPDKRTELYHRLHQILYDECPYTCLFVPKTCMLYRDYVKNVFIPKERQDLIPGASVSQPMSSVFWLSELES